MGMFDGHGAFDGGGVGSLAGRVVMFKWGWLMAMGPLNRNESLVGRVRVSTWDGAWPWGP